MIENCIVGLSQRKEDVFGAEAEAGDVPVALAVEPAEQNRVRLNLKMYFRMLTTKAEIIYLNCVVLFG